MSLLACFAAGAGLGWLGVFVTWAAISAPRPAGERAPWILVGEVPQALTTYVAARCRLDWTAYRATILDLAGRGQLTRRDADPGEIWIGLPSAGASDDAPLAESERLVLRDARGALAELAEAPLEALVGATFADVPGVWAPFDQAIRAQARDRGLTQPRVPAAVRATLTIMSLLTSGLTVAALWPAAGENWFWSIVAGVVLLTILSKAVRRLNRRDRLTPAGAALARAVRLGLAAYPAAGLTGPAAVPPNRVKVTQGDPSQAWSALTGTWRLVPIWSGQPSRAEIRKMGLPPEREFCGQVIARWIATSSDDPDRHHVAIDDGYFAWAFDVGPAAFQRLALRDRVRARIRTKPGKMELLDLAQVGPEGETRPGDRAWGSSSGQKPAPWG